MRVLTIQAICMVSVAWGVLLYRYIETMKIFN